MSMVRYLILRTLIFVGCLAATWLLGMRDREEQLLAVVIAAVASLVISAFVLKPFRQQASADIAERVDRRGERRRDREGGTDEAAEDAEIRRPATRTDDAGSDSDFR
ncbi:DUF4229 domain-containing protein [Knoellia sp. LjRoot47]|uniref:DUF4229 domain-containing protein n=1 Tax=Knoellia sp. LjRoot47 TaxID=3342330 RepID=UPI003ECE66C2